MQKQEYWFLDAAIRLKLPFHWLSANNVDALLNRTHHQLSTPALLAVLEGLFARGDLFLEYVDRHGQSRRAQAPSRDEIEAALRRSPDTAPAFYGVTAQGGAQWEALSHPRWDLFFEETYGIEPYQGEISASTRGLIEARLALVPYDPWIQTVLPESIRWSVLQPWQATYWKQLPVGYRLDFTYIPLTEEEQAARVTPPDRAHKWYTSYLDPEG